MIEGNLGVPVALGRKVAPELEFTDPVEFFRQKGFAFPAERAAVATIQEAIQKGRYWEHTGSGTEPVEWGIKTGLLDIGDIDCGEVSASKRCTESCTGCPDSFELLKRKIKKSEEDAVAKNDPSLKIPRNEPRASSELMLERAKLLRNLGVKHIMNIGGTIDKLKNLTDQIKGQLEMGFVVSWFTDCIPQIDEVTTQPNELLKANLEDGWIREVATHVSTDYLYGYGSDAPLDLFADELVLPSKRGRQEQFAEDAEESRRFKSQYGAVGARRLIEAGVRRVVLNMTISHANFHQTGPLYDQAVALQEYAASIGSPTEVLFTFSSWVYRPHQARGEDEPSENPPEGALHMEDMPAVNAALLQILQNTYRRLENGLPRILANSSGYTLLHANPAYNRQAVEQDVAYPDGMPLLLQVNPDGAVELDPMAKGPELVVMRSTFGYMDRTLHLTRNPFVPFHDVDLPYLPNIISLRTRTEEAAQPMRLAA